MDLLTLLRPFLMLAIAALGVLALILVRRSRWSAYLITLSGFFAALVSLWPLASANRASPGFFFVLERPNLIALGLVIASGAIGALVLRKFLKKRGGTEEYFYYLLTSTLGAAILVSTNHFGIWLIALNVFWLPLCVMFPAGGTIASQVASAIRLFIFGQVVSAVVTFELALVYFKTGTLQISKALSVVTGAWLLAGLAAVLMLGLLTRLKLRDQPRPQSLTRHLPVTFITQSWEGNMSVNHPPPAKKS